MKRTLVTICSIILLSLVVILFVNAREGGKQNKKAKTEIRSDCGKCPVSPACGNGVMTNNSGTEAEKPVTAKCNPAVCPGHSTDAAGESKKCYPATCPEHDNNSANKINCCTPLKCPAHPAASANK